MAKFNDYVRGRTDGLTLELKIVERDGIEGLRQEIKFRNQTGINTSLAVKELDAASGQIKLMTLDTMTVLTTISLHEEFDFGAKRCQRLLNRMTKKAENILAEMATWQDYIDVCQEEMKKELKIRMNN